MIWAPMMKRFNMIAGKCLLLACAVLLFSCSNSDGGSGQPNGTDSDGNDSQKEEDSSDQVAFEWEKAADSAQHSLVNFYDRASKSYTRTNKTKDWTGYWPTAHTLDVLVDGYLRTKEVQYLSEMSDLLTGMKAKNNGQWINSYYDDMEWMTLATLRAFEATNDSKFKEVNDLLWIEIKDGWSDELGGGIWWSKDKGGKNAVSNGPASIIASRRYKIFGNTGDLEWAKKLYSWERSTLFNVNGGVWDNINKDGEIKKDVGWIFSYNQGTFLGAAMELYSLTEEDLYLQDAMRAADYALNALTQKGDILKDLGGGDGGLFNGIFIRYLTDLIKSDFLPEEKEAVYVKFIEHNAQTLWERGTNKDLVLFGSNWKTRPATQVDLTIQLSGIMLLEAAADLSENGFF